MACKTHNFIICSTDALQNIQIEYERNTYYVDMAGSSGTNTGVIEQGGTSTGVIEQGGTSTGVIEQGGTSTGVIEQG